MAIRLPQGFSITSRDPVDPRFILSKDLMLNILETEMPSQYFVLCSDDNQLYIYDKDNTYSVETGKFILATEEVKQEIQDLDASLATVAKSGDIKHLSQMSGDTIILDCNP